MLLKFIDAIVSFLNILQIQGFNRRPSWTVIVCAIQSSFKIDSTTSATGLK